MGVRRVRPEEWRDLRDLRLRALVDYPGPLPDVLAAAQARNDEDWRGWGEECASSGTSAVFVDERFDAMVGAELDDPETVMIYGMWVAPALRGKRLGAALIECAAAWAGAAGARTLKLWVATTNDPARALYARLGFVPTGLRSRRAADLDEELVLGLDSARGLQPGQNP